MSQDSENTKTKWYVGFFSKEKESIEYFYLEEVDKNKFKEEFDPVYDFEYMEDLKYCVVKNYIDFEDSIKELGSEHKKNIKNHSSTFIKVHQTNIQRTFLNLINSHKALLDHTMHTLSSRHGSESIQAIRLKKILSYYYDNNPGYKIFDNLRNYSQHRSMPPISILRQTPNEDNNGYLHIFLMKEVLKEDKKTRSKLKHELNSPHNFDFLSLSIDWIKEVLEIYEYFLDVFADNAREPALKILSYLYNAKTIMPSFDYELYLIADAGDITKSENNIKQQYSALPVTSCVSIINRLNSEDKTSRSKMIDDLVKNDEENAENEKMQIEKYGFSLTSEFKDLQIDTITLRALRQWFDSPPEEVDEEKRRRMIELFGAED